MNNAYPNEFCTIEHTPGRIRMLIRHAPALLPGALTPREEGSRVMGGFAKEVASRLNEARAMGKRGQIYFSEK